ncbi:hypothetical protein B0H17DRAFT_398290 [Mycena rosella]|uniref:Uncharacterized protein n=1 Tax=Mycena rosella TaxID=1033263 RepID=A0AAD7DP64_MYCRO|nr:hypothetical protein B0H17DRAFT_398290 [Mycena rosella]
MKFLLFPLISIVVFAASGSNARAIRLNPFVDIASQPKDTCEVHAQVRAEDLSPDHISHGELRIKVPRTQCAQQIASVALRLQLDEFTEVKFLKNGAVPSDVNKSSPAWMSDPELWTIGAEERRAWVTEANLLADNPDFSRPIVTPFTVAVPAVNYPPAVDRYRNWYSPILRHSFSDLGYRYIAVVTFSDGRSVDVPAGHTTFVPTVHASPEQAPFTWNATFAEWSTSRCGDDSPEEKKRADELERCLPEAQRSAFVAEVTLESGNVVTKGVHFLCRPVARLTACRVPDKGKSDCAQHKRVNIHVSHFCPSTNCAARSLSAGAGGCRRRHPFLQRHIMHLFGRREGTPLRVFGI